MLSSLMKYARGAQELFVMVSEAKILQPIARVTSGAPNERFS